MIKKLQSFTIDAAMMLLMYYGLYAGNEYAANAFWPVLWVFVFLSVLIMAAFTNKEVKDKIKETRTPKKEWEYKYSLAYDTMFSLALAALGFAWSAAIWWVVQWLARGCVQSLDEEIKSEV